VVLWLTRALLLPNGDPGVVLLHVDTSFCTAAASAATVEGSTAFALEASTVLGDVGADQTLDLDEAHGRRQASIGVLSIAGGSSARSSATTRT